MVINRHNTQKMVIGESFPDRVSVNHAGVKSQPYSPPPYAVQYQYTQKPLPPLPVSRASFSSFGLEPNHPSTVPRVIRDHIPFLLGRGKGLPSTPEDGNPTRRRIDSTPVPFNHKSRRVSFRTDQTTRTIPARLAQRIQSMIPTFNRQENCEPFPNIVPGVPPEEILSPQPKQSAQKILQLSEDMSPARITSVIRPPRKSSLQNRARHTIAQSRYSSTENQFHSVDEILTQSMAENARAYGEEAPKAPEVPEVPEAPEASEVPVLSPCRSESVYSTSDVDVESAYDWATPLKGPRFSAPPTFCDTPSITQALVRDALRLSDLLERDSAYSEGSPTTKRSSFYEQDDSDNGSSYSSSDKHSDATEAESTVGEMLEKPAVSRNILALRKPPRRSMLFSSSLPSPPANPYGDLFVDCRSNFMVFDEPEDDSDSDSDNTCSTDSPEPNSSTPSPSVTRTLPSRHFGQKQSLSARRLAAHGRVPDPLHELETAPESSSSSWRNSSRAEQTPYPSVSSSIDDAIEEAATSPVRQSLLSKIFPGALVQKRASMQSTASDDDGSITSSGVLPAIEQRDVYAMQQPVSAWSPDTPAFTTDKSLLDDENPGILRRTLDHARYTVIARRTIYKAEKRKKKRMEGIRIVRLDDPDMASGSMSAPELDPESEPEPTTKRGGFKRWSRR